MTPEFRSIFFDTQASFIECSCGRTHFGGRECFDWDEGQYEGLQKQALETPDRVIEHDGGARAGEHLAGRVIVEDCPCHEADHLEEFLWEHAKEISSYLRMRAKREITTLAKKAFDAGTLSGFLALFEQVDNEVVKRANAAFYALIK